MASGSDMKSELFELQRQMNEKTDESLESTRRMLTMCEESQDAGAKTLGMLSEQGEKLERIEHGMTQINEDMRQAERNLRDLEKCCGLCVLPWNRGKRVKVEEVRWKAVEDGNVCTEAPKAGLHGEVTQSQGPFIKRITNDSREDEMEQNLSEVSGIIGNLKNMAIDMQSEIGSQNKQLDRINQQATTLDDKVQNANSRANKMLKS